MADEPNSQAQRIDALGRRFIAELQADARRAYAALGANLGVTGMTAANRLQRLNQADLIRLKTVPNLAACGLKTEILGLVQAEVGVIAACLDLLRQSPAVMRVDRVTGEYDLSFSAAFPSEAAMGGLVRDLQAVQGVRRLVVHHRMETVKDDDGWSAVWADSPSPADAPYELAPGTVVPENFRSRVATGAAWLQAFVRGDLETLRELSEPDIVFTIMPPQIGAGTFAGLLAVEAEATVAGQIYRHLWHRVIDVSETSSAPYEVVIDALNTAEQTKGQVRTGFARMAIGFVDGRVHRVLSLGQMELPDVPAPAPHRQTSEPRA